MLIDEAGHEEVAVVVAGLTTQDQRVIQLGADRLQALRLELLLEELITLALLDEQLLTLGAALARLLDQLAGVPLRPLGAVIAEIAAEGFLAPRAGHRIDDRREGRDRTIAARILQRADQRAVAAHGVTGDRLTLAIHREVTLDERRQLLGDVVIHAVMTRPRLAGGIDVEACATAEVVAVVFAVQIDAARTGVRADQGDAQLRRLLLRAGLLHEVLVGAGQPRQPPQHRHRALFGLGRQIDGEHHVAIQAAAAVTVTLEPAAMHLVGADQLELFGRGHHALPCDIAHENGVGKPTPFRVPDLTGQQVFPCCPAAVQPRIRSSARYGSTCLRAADRRIR